MARFNNASITTLNIPHDSNASRRITGFYRELGWNDIRKDTEEQGFWYVGPYAHRTPTLTYWQTQNAGKTPEFITNHDPHPSEFSRGLHLPAAAMATVALVETVLIVPSDNDVLTLWENGGELLEAHATVRLREHPNAGAQEFRFHDPYGFTVRVTSDPELQMPVSPLPIR